MAAGKLCNMRITKELKKLLSDDKLEGIVIEEPQDIMRWNVKIKGAPGTFYEDGIFDMLIRFDEDYPVKPPSVKFLTPMFHPNIYRDGKICVDILQYHEWTPSQNIRTILISIQSLLMDPNPASPANREAAELYGKDIKEYEKKVRQFIKENHGKLL
jgi:ubiquitin-conjugating enzyme E2 A